MKARNAFVAATMSILASSAWAGLDAFKKPEWFENARFGVFCHWGIQCTPEAGDWYGHNMYKEGHWQNKYHKEHYGDPKEFGLKDFAPLWKAENWNPDELIALYKRMGARYIVAMANHHDNFDNFDSKYQPWNSVKLGPKKDIIGGWAKAARKAGMRFGVSVHASHAWTWYEYGRETGDTLATKEQGKGKWWEGLDPQQLYCQQHEPSPGYQKETEDPFNVWVWGDKCCKPSEAFIENFRLRTMDLIEKYHPDLLYFDDVVLPFHGISDVGWRIVDDYHALNAKWHGGKSEGIVNGKRLWPAVCDKLTRNIERGSPGKPMYPHWQTDTCIGDWHYDRGWFRDNRYRGARGVLRTLVDTVAKNGNLVISIPIRADGTIDEKERAICEEIAAWIEVNGKAIFDTVPYEICGEGPQIEKASELGDDVEFNEGRIPQPGKEDVRYLKSKDGKTLYAVALVPPDEGEKPKFSALKGNVASAKRLKQVKDFPAVWECRLK